MAKLLDVLFGCSHKNYTFPITLRSGRRGGASASRTYVVCLDCGREFAYDWKQMKMVSDEPAPQNLGGITEPAESYAVK
jgi:hypothetical protein